MTSKLSKTVSTVLIRGLDHFLQAHKNLSYLLFLNGPHICCIICTNITKLKIFTDSLCLIFFLILFYDSFEITAEAFIKNHNTGTIWGPPLWIPYSSMLIGATLMTMSYIAELIKLIRKLKEF